MTDEQGLRVGRWATIGWGLAFIAPATIFRSDEGNIVVLALGVAGITYGGLLGAFVFGIVNRRARSADANIAFVVAVARSEEHTSELQSRGHLVCRLLLEKKKKQNNVPDSEVIDLHYTENYT